MKKILITVAATCSVFPAVGCTGISLTAKDGSCNFNLSRITYWHDDEDEKGGVKMIAENWITDDNAFNKKGELKRFEGKFRRKTIDLKEHLIDELTKALN